jgi:hypothetical protein
MFRLHIISMRSHSAAPLVGPTPEPLRDLAIPIVAEDAAVVPTDATGDHTTGLSDAKEMFLLPGY